MVAIFVILLVAGATSLPLSDFYEFGLDVGDTALEPNDDVSHIVNFPSAFNVFGAYWRNLSVSKNIQCIGTALP